MASVPLLPRAPIFVVLLSGFFLAAILLLLQPTIERTGGGTPIKQRTNNVPLPVISVPKNDPYEKRVFNMSFPGYTSICNDSLPPPFSGSDRLASITHHACCEGPGATGSDGKRHVCRTANKQIQIPVDNERAIRASGERAVRFDSVDFVHSLVFVTAASPDHFQESLIQLNSIQKYFPCTRVLYWGMGLQPDQVTQLQTFCGVEYRRFNFTKYPQHVATLKTYAFKPLVIMESFMEHPVLWWLDTSIRFTSEAWRKVIPLVKERHGMLFFRDYEHSIWSATYPQTYEYLATDVEMMKRLLTITGASYIVVNTPEIFSTVLYWFYACAMDVRCIAPIMYPEECFLKGLADFAHCHRFDQSILTIIVATVWGFDSEGYRYREDFFVIHRDTKGDNKVKQCSLPEFESRLKTDVCRAF